MTEHLMNVSRETDKETAERNTNAIPMQCSAIKSFSVSSNPKIQDMKL